MSKQCPVCKGKRFIVNATVIQQWVVDEGGLCKYVWNDFVHCVHEADDTEIWQCMECGYEAKGSEFNVEE